jgi:tetratricopeptide (TPR) repeat protein
VVAAQLLVVCWVDPLEAWAAPSACDVGKALEAAGEAAAARRVYREALTRDPTQTCDNALKRMNESGVAAPVCDVGKALEAAGEREAARRVYVEGLQSDPKQTCENALKNLINADKRTEAGKPAANCVRANAMADAGAEEQAEALYVDILKGNNIECAREGLAELNEGSIPSKIADGLKSANTLTALALTLLALLFVVAAVAFVGGTYSQRTRGWMADRRWLRSFFRPRLAIATIEDGGANPAVGEGVSALVRAKIASLMQPQGGYSLDQRTGTESLAKGIVGLAEAAPQLKGVAAVLGFAGEHAKLPRYTLGGTLQAAGVLGGGITAVLDKRREREDVLTLWSHEPSADPPTPSQFHALAAGAAAWTDYMIRRNERLQLPERSGNASSFAYLHVGLQLALDRQTAAAIRSFEVATISDPQSVAAMLNVGVLLARQGNFDESISWLTVARRVLDPDS